MAAETKPALKIVSLTTVDSTSTHAARLLAQGEKAPFLVWAEAQTGGRGRRGNQWQSPAGNLYLTLVLPPPADSVASQGLLPLKAGVVVAQLVQAHLKVRLTLKWPNDLLFAACKVGGLLLESSLSGTTLGEVIIGLGLNLNQAPAVASGDYQITCLSDILGHRIDVQAFVQMIASEFWPAWQALPTAAVPAAFSAFALGEGELCYKDEATRPRRWARLGAVQGDGCLSLVPMQEPAAAEVLSSAEHGWRWVYQGHEAAPLAVADVGNSSVKLAWFAAARAPRPQMVEVSGHAEAADALPRALRLLQQSALAAGCQGWPLHILSVRPQAAAVLARLAREAGFSPLFLAKRPVRRHGDGYNMNEIGADRLAAIEGWLAALSPAERAGPRRFSLIIAAGTATTVDAVATDGTHFGGLILPGLTLALRSLHEAASLLPDIDAKKELTLSIAKQGLGHDTRSAMLSAAVAMTLGAFDQVRARVRAEHGIEPAAQGFAVTGGWGELVAAWLGVAYDPHLVLSGARAMVLGGFVREAAGVD